MTKRKKIGTKAAAGAAPWLVEFFRRHRLDDPEEHVPAREFMARCPDSVVARMATTLEAVAAAPPPRFSGGGFWEVMRDDMKGIYKVSVDQGHLRHYRLFCVLENPGTDVGLRGPSIVVLTGGDKPFGAVFTDAEYGRIRELRDEYVRRRPRSVAQR